MMETAMDIIKWMFAFLSASGAVGVSKTGLKISVKYP